MENSLVSIVVPVYNVELYIRKCIESILKQTYQNFELILVDDGSTDKSMLIIEKYINDKRIKVFNKKNGGLSDARNFGIDRANGKYITFIDSDDEITNKYLENLVIALESTNSDISIVSYNNIDEDNIVSKLKHNNKVTTFNKQQILLKMYNRKHNIDFITAWGKLYKINLFNDIRYPYGKINEDEATTYKLYLKSKRIAFKDTGDYLYRTRYNSIMNSSYSLKKLDILEIYKERIDNLVEENCSENIIVMTEYMYCLNIIDNLIKINKYNLVTERIESIKRDFIYYYNPTRFLLNKVNILRIIKLIIMKIKYL